MGRTMTSYPWGGAAFLAPTVSGYGQKIKSLFSFDKSRYQRFLQSIAILHLFGIEVLNLRSDVMPITLFFSITGLVLILLTLSKNMSSDVDTPKSNFVVSEREELKHHAESLLLHSKTFLDIAQATSRPKEYEEIRDRLWADLTARISHELRTPLNAVIGFSDLMASETFGPLGQDRYRDYIRHIQDSCRDLLKSTETTLALTSSLRKESIKVSSDRISLLEKIRNVSEVYRSEIQKRAIGLQIFADPTLEIVGEESQIQQILFNIFAESLSRVEDGGSLEIRTEASGKVLALSFKIIFPKKKMRFEQSSLELCIARILLDKQGSRLIQIDEEELWHTQLFLELAQNNKKYPHKVSA